MTNGVVLKIRGIRKAFPGVVALDGAHFELLRGEVHVLLGENGAGKSTLMKILSGAYQKDAGEILLEGQPVDIRNPRHAQELGLSIIYQEFNLIRQLSAGENIFLGREPVFSAGLLDTRKLFRQALILLNELGVPLDPRLPVHSLSVAQQQIVEVAKALSVQAKILIMDEPTSGLSRTEIQQLFATIRRLQQRGVSIIYISHRLEELFEIGERVTVMRDGKTIATHSIAEVSVPQLVRLMANREFKEHFPKKRAPLGEEILRIERLNSGRRLQDISFAVRRGEVVALAGLLGSGRTELARAIFGADSVDSGRLFVKGTSVRPRSPADAIRLGIGFLTEDRKSQGLVVSLSVRDNITLPSTHRLARAGILNSAAEASLAERFVRELRIKTTGLGQRVMFLSGGNQQKVVLSKWLACRADLLIFDEPTRGIDVAAKVEIYQIMNRLTATGAAILMISSDLPEVLGMSDRILVLHQGRLAGEFRSEEATEEKIMRAALGQES